MIMLIKTIQLLQMLTYKEYHVVAVLCCSDYSSCTVADILQ